MRWAAGWCSAGSDAPRGFAYRNKDHADYLAKRLGEPPTRSLRPAAMGIVMALVGALMLATTDMTIDMLAPRTQ